MALRGPWCFADDALSAIESYYYSSPCKRRVHTRTLGLAPREARDWQNGNGTLIKQSESICNYSNHGRIMEKTFTRTVYVKLPFDSFVVSLWIFFLHSVFMSSSNCGFNTAVHLGSKSNDTFSLLQQPVRLWPTLTRPTCARIANVCRYWLFRRIRVSRIRRWYWFTVGDVHQWSLRRGSALEPDRCIIWGWGGFTSNSSKILTGYAG